ncbi:MAG: 30S ribosome-binding factor RbfA [Henriciella sp.]
MSNRGGMPKRGQRNLGGSEPSQRQLRAGELIRHALVDVLSREEFRDPELQTVAITIGEVRCSPDLKHATIFCSPLGSTDQVKIKAVAEALGRAARFLRGRLSREIELKYTPQLHFVPDLSYDEASAMDAVFRRADVQRDLS